MVRVVVAHTDARLLVATRTRPSWATPRRKLYGEILELDRFQLAMNDGEPHDWLERGQTTRGSYLRLKDGQRC